VLVLDLFSLSNALDDKIKEQEEFQLNKSERIYSPGNHS
jgi:hypothetical protein